MQGLRIRKMQYMKFIIIMAWYWLNIYIINWQFNLDNMKAECTSSGNSHISGRMQNAFCTTFKSRFISFVFILSLSLLMLVCFINRSGGQSIIMAENSDYNLSSKVYQVLFQDCFAGSVTGPYLQDASSGSALNFSLSEGGVVVSHRSGSPRLQCEGAVSDRPVLVEAIFKLLTGIILSFLVFFVLPGVGAYIISEMIS